MGWIKQPRLSGRQCDSSSTEVMSFGPISIASLPLHMDPVVVENTWLTKSSKIDKMEGRVPFRDITNVHPTTSPKRNYSVVGEQNDPLVETRNATQMNSSQRKRYRDRDRYLQMTPYQREAYLQRNREYKRMRRECSASCSNTQPAPQQKNTRANKNICMTGKEVVASSNYEKHDSVFTQLGSSSKGKQVADVGGSGTSRPKAGTRFTISPSGIYLSSISSEDQAAKYELKNVRQRKRHRCVNMHSELSHDQEETHVQEICGHNKRQRPEKESCSTARDRGRETNNLHEDLIYVPQDSFPAIHEYLANTEDSIEYDDVDDESLMYNRPCLDFESYQEPKHVTKCIQADPYDHIYHKLPRGYHFLERVPNCRHCNAKRFQYETPTFCCMNGKVKIVTPVVPDELRQLYTSQDPNAKYFQDHIRSIMVYGKSDKPQYIKAYHGCYDPLSYALFFPNGEVGWNLNLPKVAPHGKRKRNDQANALSEEGVEKSSGSCVSPREYYCYKLQIRDGEFNVLLFGKRLTQQYIVDMYIKIESIRLAFYLQPSTQVLIRADLYQGLVDSVVAGETRACMTGKRIVLPLKFIGGPRDMR
ncbi:uncharacterized protein LOC125525078 isoform X4 [Triticum urartu]|uniref:uncharacterized protein LOC125525078 isoform X4 n=1 Tax=Triticum urartu TaxID=4572 RepID=UPI002042C9E5|nr:uncharacterized protein LOC125525078 isoform X4 [Triticum urartu]